MTDEEIKEAFEKQKREGPYYHGSGQPYCFECDEIVTADHNYFINTVYRSHSPTGALHTLAWSYTEYGRVLTRMVLGRMSNKVFR